jgi:hypothetical protein
VPTQLRGYVSFTNTLPTTNQWQLYSGLTNVAFANANQTNTMATFSTPGVYTLMLSAADGIHAVAYDAVVITVSPAITLAIVPVGPNLNLTWTGGAPPFVVERASELSDGSWSGVLTTSVQNASVPMLGSAGFFRVKGS